MDNVYRSSVPPKVTLQHAAQLDIVTNEENSFALYRHCSFLLHLPVVHGNGPLQFYGWRGLCEQVATSGAN